MLKKKKTTASGELVLVKSVRRKCYVMNRFFCFFKVQILFPIGMFTA